ncbi:unnamed protein product [Oncorhynchus mykiss]|uniref:Uncharacterized protein n=1 Tax=Oncorhynchus mykiss TaxID=8022 RepID=A0A060ZAR3_ONCMY|nr:unnamed protein product [Oncorhynchus mykiss]
MNDRLIALIHCLCSDFSPAGCSTPSSCTDILSISSSDLDLRSPERLSKKANTTLRDKAIDSAAAKEIVQYSLTSRPGGQDILEEYQTTKTLDNRTRREMTDHLSQPCERDAWETSHSSTERTLCSWNCDPLSFVERSFFRQRLRKCWYSIFALIF